jgi:translocation and assembly module TamB
MSERDDKTRKDAPKHEGHRLEKIVERVERLEVSVKRSLSSQIGRGVAWVVLGILSFVIVVVTGFAWYTSTNDFQQRMKAQVVGVLEGATGGRVELGSMHFSLRHLAVEVDKLVIHGLEGPGEAPYLSADKIQIQVKLFNFFAHTAGTGLASHVALNYLGVDHPQVHLIIDKDGKTNQPVPKLTSTSNTSLTDTLLDLKARKMELVNGLALLNNRAIPFDLAAKDLSAEVHYIATGDKYGATIDLNDLRTKMATQPEAQSTLHVEAELGRNSVELKKLNFHSGTSSDLGATASLSNFAKPEWQVRVQGSLELTQITVLSGVDGLTAGTVDLELNGHNCATAVAVAQTHSRFWQRTHPKNDQKPSKKVLPPDPDCVSGYLLAGKVKVHNAGYRNEYVRLHDINGGGQVHITPSELLLTGLTGYLPEGGSVEGRLRIANWLGDASPAAATPSPTATATETKGNTTENTAGAKASVASSAKAPVFSHAYLDATISKIPLRTIMDVTAPEHYGDLGFDTAVSGPVKVEWGGSAADVADTVEADGNLNLTPTGVKRKGALNNTQVTGQVLAHYTGKTEVVQIQQLSFQTPESTLEANGVLGVNLGDPLTVLRVDLVTKDLGEYDQLLHTLHLEANGKKGTAAIPAVLHGAMQFNGTARGEIADLDVKGHLEAASVEAKLGTTTDVMIDSVVADGEYSPNGGLAVASSTIKRGTAVLNLVGTVRPHKLVSRRGVATYVWDENSTTEMQMKLANAQVLDVLQIVGQQGQVPVTGTMAAHANARGTLKDLVVSGQVSVANGTVYGEPYDSAVADLTVQGREIEASKVVLKLHGMQIAGDGGYNLTSGHLHGHVEGNNLALSKFQTIQQAKLKADGRVSLVADANGTLAEPGVKASVKASGVTINGQAVGDASADVHSEGKMMFFAANSTILGAKVSAAGQTQLVGNYQTQAKMTVAGLDLNRQLAVFAPGNMAVQSDIGGVVTVNGPLKTPEGMSGQAEFNQFDLKLQGIELKSAGPLRLALQNGVMRLEQVHITGPDTDLRVSGTVQVFGATNSKSGKLDVKSTGSVSMALLHTFDPDILASGKVEFTVAAGGQLMNPALTGKVQFDKVNASIDGVPNGLSDMNGTLVFNEDRLQVQTLTAMTGGGQLKIGGSIRYRNGIYADLTATGDLVRVRYNGLSATANANLKLQGGPQGALLSGNVLLTRFGIGQDVDFAAFAGMGGVSAPPDPGAATNKIRLDVRVTSAPQLDFQNSYAKLSGS